MTNREAIARIKDHIEVHHIKENRAIKILQALNIAIKALERTEWHYPSKGELPEKDAECLVRTKSGNKLIAMIDSSDNCWCTGAFFSEYLRDDCVVCWQYIVPPKEEA